MQELFPTKFIDNEPLKLEIFAIVIKKKSLYIAPISAQYENDVR